MIVQQQAILAASSVTFDWESHAGGIILKKFRDGVEADSIFLQGDDALFLVEGLNNTNDRYTDQDLIADYFPSGGY